jgi:hypothetical protein
MKDFKPLIEAIEKALKRFDDRIPSIQNDMVDRLRVELKDLDLKSGKLLVNTKNIVKIAAIKSKLQGIILTPEYEKAVKELITTFAEITKLQNSYFSEISDEFSVPKFGAQLQKQAVKSLVEKLTERGMEANVTSGVEDLLRKNITSGGSYSEMQSHLENYLVNNSNGDGRLQLYTRQITTDSLNQYSAQYTQIVASDLGYEWFRYSGSNIQTTRPFCLACTDKKWIHISEFPALLKGEFPEFEEHDGKLYKGLPSGMYPDTTVSNFQINRGGYNCGHQLRPVHESQVPMEVKTRVWATPEYEIWAA